MTLLSDIELQKKLQNDKELVAGFFLDACSLGNVESVKQVMRLYDISESDKKSGVGRAVQYRRDDVVHALLPFVQKPLSGFLLAHAAGQGRLGMVETLLPFCDAKENDSLALSWAAEGGHLDVVRVLAPLSGPLGSKNTISDVVAKGRADILGFILPLCLPKYHQSLPLQIACQKNDEVIFNMLYPLSDPDEALLAMKSQQNLSTLLLENRIKADKSKKHLQEHLDPNQKQQANKNRKF